MQGLVLGVELGDHLLRLPRDAAFLFQLLGHGGQLALLVGELGFQLFDVRDLRVLRARVFLQLCGIVRLRGVELLVERINIAEHRFLIKAAKSGGLKSPRFSHNSTAFPMVRGMV